MSSSFHSLIFSQTIEKNILRLPTRDTIATMDDNDATIDKYLCRGTRNKYRYNSFDDLIPLSRISLQSTSLSSIPPSSFFLFQNVPPTSPFIFRSSIPTKFLLEFSLSSTTARFHGIDRQFAPPLPFHRSVTIPRSMGLRLNRLLRVDWTTAR